MALSKRQARNVGALMAGVVLAVTIAVLTACAGNPTQAWLTTCEAYYETLRSVNDALELGTINKQSDAAQSMKQAVAVLSPVCKGETPPDAADREGIQEMLDKILLDLAKAERGS